VATHSLLTLFNFDPLANIVIVLVGFIAAIVGCFAYKYMAGDTNKRQFFYSLTLLVIALMVMAATDHVLVFLVAWGISNFLLISLMIHKSQWQAATNSGLLAAKTLVIGFACLALAFIIFYLGTNQTSIRAILTTLDPAHPLAICAGALIIIAAMAQSAIWPFHRWLLSSLNSPTPVSAIMHAGLVNGGGVLLARFSPLYFSESSLLTVIFVFGLVTACTASVWKLMQSDIKRMLACSTMAQMGFMFVQCGLGLFPAAIAHLCWHGLFKTNLFLNANSAQQDKRIMMTDSPSLAKFTLALLLGAYGSYIFSLASHQAWLSTNTSLFLMIVVLVAASQLALQLLQTSSWKRLPFILLVTTLVFTSYGYSIYLIEALVAPMNLMRPLPLNSIHYVGMAVFVSMWLAILFSSKFIRHPNLSTVREMLYVKNLNASQPDPATVTAHRHQYAN
jgi:NAD(P)H-quinone oxidoreductase subunit 5